MKVKMFQGQGLLAANLNFQDSDFFLLDEFNGCGREGFLIRIYLPLPWWFHFESSPLLGVGGLRCGAGLKGL